MFLVEDFNVNALIDELVSILFNEENPKSHEEVVKYILPFGKMPSTMN